MASALDPLRFDGQSVTVSGRFRGRNLFGDQPAARGRSKFDFVIQLADSSVWVVGPSPEGARLRPERRRARRHRSMARGAGRRPHEQGARVDRSHRHPHDAARVRQAPAETTTAVAAPRPPPQVIFSTPTAGEVDVTADVRVRLQFSRDMTPQSFKGNVHGGV